MSNMIRSVNPYDLSILAEFKENTQEECIEKIEQLEEGYKRWKNETINFRSQILISLSNKLRKNRDKLSLIITKEMGKPIKQALAEIDKCAWVCEYYAEEAPNILKDKKIETDASLSFVRYEALGLVFCVMPWNFPFWQFFRVLAPNLMLGNVLLLKHASSVSLCAQAIKNLIDEVSLHYTICDYVIVPGSKLEAIVQHPLVKAMTLTGSEQAGRSFAALAGKHLKKSVLELGGSNAVLILKDANLDKYMEEILWSRFQNTGQSCIAGKRYLVCEEKYEDFKSRLIEKIKGLKSIDPLDPECEIGPMSNEKLAMELEIQIQSSIAQGARLLYGGKRKGAYFEPSLIEIDSSALTVFQEETFGPLAVLMKFKTNKEAIELSNASNFGLGASIFTENIALALEMQKSMEEGAVFINSMVKSDPRLPFGGIKNSGYGRELGEEALKEFANVKTVFVK